MITNIGNSTAVLNSNEMLVSDMGELTSSLQRGSCVDASEAKQQK